MEEKFCIVGGTRPELIKLAPVYREFRRREIPVQFWLTGQHESLADGPISFFGIQPDRHWKTLSSGQSSNHLLAKLLNHMDDAIVETRPSVMIVQGDTTSALAGALAAFHRQIPVAHVEAGLRTGDLSQPFPEEMNRCVIDAFAKWLFPPTMGAKQALHLEGRQGISEPTGNTGIDALFWAREKVQQEKYWPSNLPLPGNGVRLILSTGHRRENLGSPLHGVLRTLGEEVTRANENSNGKVMLFHVSHPNPLATQSAETAFSEFNSEYIKVVSALSYPDFVALLDRASVIVTDSGGLQEEAPSFGLPILITRDTTERPEVLGCGGVLVGTNSDTLRVELRKALEKGQCAERRTQKTPFGDGMASRRIVDRLLADCRKQEIIGMRATA